MNWTKERPTKPGRYVAKINKLGNPFIASVFISNDELLVDSGYQNCPITIKHNFFNNWEWVGPPLE